MNVDITLEQMPLSFKEGLGVKSEYSKVKKDKQIYYHSFLFRLYMRFLLILLLGCIGLSVRAEKYYDFNPLCRQAYNELICLRIEGGKKLLNQERQLHPDNLIPYFLDNYADFYSLFFNEDFAEFEKKMPLKETHLAGMRLGPTDSHW